MKFRFVDRILAWTPRRAIRGVKTVSFEEYQLKAAFGGEPALPESLLVEGLFQLGNWLIVLSSGFAEMALRFEEVRFHDALRPGQAVRMEAVVRSWRTDGVLFDGLASAGGRTIAEGRGCLAAPVALADYCDPADLQVLFSEIYRPESCEDQPPCRG
jgi:3-hydroxymyristoyl/3-hydroxydecanoyl-(acyl carrier protein) dehydratase